MISGIKILKSLYYPKIFAFVHYFEDIENFYILLEIFQKHTLNEFLKHIKDYGLRVIHSDLKLGKLFLTDKI